MASAPLLLSLLFVASASAAVLNSGVQIRINSPEGEEMREMFNAALKKLPADEFKRMHATYARICYRGHPTEDLNECLRESIQKLIKSISGEGIRQLNLPPLDPWFVPEMSVTLGSGNPFKVSFISRNSHTYGFSRLKIVDVRAELDDPQSIKIEVDFTNDKIFTEGDYEAEGTVSDFPVLGKGHYNVSIADVTGTFKLKGHLVERDGDEFLLVDRATMRPDVGNMTVKMTNENRKYPELTNLFVGLINQFWKSIYIEAAPFMEDMFDQIVRPTFNLATLKVPYNQLIPKYEE